MKLTASPPKLLAIGGASVDRRGRSNGPFVAGVSNPGSIREEIGGAAFNTARAAARMGANVAMMTVRGGDMAGQAVASAIKAAGFDDLSSIHPDRSTPSYTAIIDRHGESCAALADMALYDAGFGKLVRRASTRKAVAAADAVLIDANLPEEAIAELLSHGGAKPVFANAVSPAKATRLSSALPAFTCLFTNANEAAALTGADRAAAAAFRGTGLKSGVVTDGPGSILLFDEASAWRLLPPEIQAIDVTGAGDALAGAAIARLLQGHDLPEAVRHGAAAAALVAGSAEVSPDFSHDSLLKLLETVPEPERLKP